MGIQINGNNDTITAIDGSITVGTNLTVPGVLTYASVDAVGLSTFQNGLNVTGGSVGIGTDSNLTANLTIGNIEETSTNNKGALAIKTLANSDTDIGHSAIYIEEPTSGYGFYHKVSTYFSTTHYQFLESGSANTLFTISDTGDVGIKTNYADTFCLKLLSEDENVIKIENTHNGSTGSDIRIFQDSNSPQANDKLLALDVRGNDSAGNETTYSKVIASIEDPTNGSEDGKFTIQTRTAGTLQDRILISSNGVGIGTNDPNAKLEVRDGKIRAGEDQATIGGTILEGRYSDGGDILNILGSHHSNGATVLSYGMRPKTGASGYVSSFANFSGGRAALEMWGEGAQIVTAPSQNTAVGSDLTDVAGAVMVRNNGDVTMRGTDSQYIEMASFRTTNGNTADTGLVALNGGDLDFTPLQNTNASVIVHSTVTNPSRITFPVAGVVHLNYHQDIRSGNAVTASSYERIVVKLNGSGISRNTLLTSTGGFWDSIIGTATVEVAANDYIELELTCNTTLAAWDDSGWSSYNFIFAPINTDR